MIKTILLALVVLLIAIGFGYLIHQDSGYVLIAYHGWTLETGLWIGLLLLVVALLLLYLIFKILAGIFTLDRRIRNYLKKRNEHKTLEYLENGYQWLAEGNGAKAEEKLVKAATNERISWVSMLGAANAAQLQHAIDRRDEYLNRALAKAPKSELAVKLYQAELQIKDHQWQPALMTLENLHENSPHHPQINKLLCQIYLALNDWRQLSLLLPNLNKSGALLDDEYEAIEENTFLGLIRESSYIKDTQALWNTLSKSQTRDPHLVHAYANQLIKFGQGSLALPIIERALKDNWSTDLIHVYGIISNHHNAHQLTVVEAWLKTHPQDPELLLCAGRLCIREQFWGKAKHYLDSSLQFKPTKEAWIVYAKLNELLGNKDAALDCYRKAVL